jgi:AcrR family transcriptional regulator
MTSSALSPQLRPRKVPRQHRAVETRARILDAARTVIAEHGYAHGTTNRIAEAAGLSVGSLYQYFPNKDAILVELVDAHIAAGTDAVAASMARVRAAGDAGDDRSGQSSLDALVRPVVDAMVRLHSTDARLHRVLFEEAPRPPEQLARLRALERDLTDVVASLLDGHPEVHVADVRVAARLAIDTIESLVHRVATDEGSGIAPDLLADEITHLVVAYLSTPRR